MVLRDSLARANNSEEGLSGFDRWGLPVYASSLIALATFGIARNLFNEPTVIVDPANSALKHFEYSCQLVRAASQERKADPALRDPSLDDQIADAIARCNVPAPSP